MREGKGYRLLRKLGVEYVEDKEWEIIVADEKDILDERVKTFINNIAEDGYYWTNIQYHYSTRNFQWEALVMYK